MPIPLPALNVQPPQQPDVLGQLSKIRMLQAMGQEQQLRQQQLQGAQLENQQRQLDMQSQQAVMRAYQESDGDLTKTLPLAAKYGARPDALIKLKEASINQQKQNIDLLNAKGQRALQEADLMQGAHDQLAKLPPEQRAAAYPLAIQKLAEAGVDTSNMPQQYPGDDAFQLGGIALKGHKQQLEELAKQAELEKTQAQTGQAVAETAKLKAETNPDNPTDPKVREAKYSDILNRLNTKQPVTPQERNWAKSYEFSQRKSTSSSDSLGIVSSNVSGPAGLSAVGGGGTGGGRSASSPQSVKDGLVDQIGQYKLNPMMLSRMTMKHPEIIAAVTQKYPDWNQPQYNAINRAVSDLAPNGTVGKQVTSYNTFLRHAGDLYDAIGTLDNSQYSDLLNKPMNWLRQHSGDPRVKDVLAAIQPVQKEFQTFIVGGHALYEDDRKDAQKLMDENSTPQEMRAVLQRMAHTGGARLSEINNSFKRVTNRDIPNLVSQEAAQAYNKITGQGGQQPQAGDSDPFAAFGGKKLKTH